MLDPRLYRAVLLPALLAVIVTAFSVRERPRPLATTLAPDAFVGARAAAELDKLATEFPDRRPGSPQDEALAARVAHELRARLKIPVRVHRFRADTVDGRRELTTVVATRPGAPGPGVVVLSHRDAVGHGAKAELSGTAAMLELARVVADGRLTRTITFVSTSGGSGGGAGAADAVSHLPRPINAAIVLGSVAGVTVRRPLVTGWSSGQGQAPLRLRRTADAAVRAQTGMEPGAPRAVTQWVRMAFPLTVGEQGELGRRGLPAVLIQASGERPPAAAEPVSPRRLESFGRAALGSIYALDAGAPIGGGPREDLVVMRKVLPSWAVRLLVGALLAPALLVSVDGLARIRRRRQPIVFWLPWLLSCAAPFVAAAAFAMLLAWLHLIDATGAPPPPGAQSFDGAAKAGLAAIGLVFALGWLLRPSALRRLAPGAGTAGSPGAGAAVALTLCALALVVFVLNPYAAAFLILPVNLWMVAAAPDVRLPRRAGLAVVALGLVPIGLAAIVDAHALGYGPLEFLWVGALLIGGGHVGVITWLLWSLVGGCAVGAGAMALSTGRRRTGLEVAVRSPLTYRGSGAVARPHSLPRG
jgi:hypothetical protein